MTTPAADRPTLRAGTGRASSGAAARVVVMGACVALAGLLTAPLAGCKSDGPEAVGAGPSTTSGTFYQSPTMGTPMPTSGTPGVRSSRPR